MRHIVCILSYAKHSCEGILPAQVTLSPSQENRYIEYRRFCNLSVPETWEELAADIPDGSVRAKLRSLYGHPANIDLWVGGVAEKRLPDALMGPTFACIIGDQFRRLRDGDRFWYENDGIFTKLQLQQIKKASLARLLCDNGDNIDRVQPNVFFYPGNSTKFYGKCENIPELNLNMWMNCCDSSCTTLPPPGKIFKSKSGYSTLTLHALHPISWNNPLNK
ncbi:unnamed protein product [Strongylus vulgaris]|uniref:Peroxidase n=1 Tax=Strongylus vulgaris TaxID=40348 RepID=A0A3P7LEU6_STRVU|nr:unnamed protein product [Strongylus vulgaris]